MQYHLTKSLSSMASMQFEAKNIDAMEATMFRTYEEYGYKMPEIKDKNLPNTCHMNNQGRAADYFQFGDSIDMRHPGN